MVLLYLLLALIVIGLDIFLCVEFNVVANRKGYPGTKYGWIVFFTWIPGMLLVIALPDQSQHSHAPSAPVYDDALPEL